MMARLTVKAGRPSSSALPLLSLSVAIIGLSVSGFSQCWCLLMATRCVLGYSHMLRRDYGLSFSKVWKKE